MSHARFGILFPLGEFCIFSKDAIVVFNFKSYTREDSYIFFKSIPEKILIYFYKIIKQKESNL